MYRAALGACLLISAPAFATSTLERSGDILHLLLPAVTLGGSVMAEKNTATPYAGIWQLAKTGVSSRVLVEGVKYAFPKDRPDGSDDDSFPSGHTADTFATASFIQARYGWEWGAPAYAIAAYVGYTRVASDKHYTEDVLAGAAIGTLAGLYFSEPFKGITITPIAGKQGYGVQFSGRF